MRAAWILGVVLAVTCVPLAAAVEDPHGIGYDGHDWKRMSEPERYAYVSGFLAGAIAQEAIERHQAKQSVAIDSVVQELLRTHASTFPFGANAYTSDLSDYYFYTNNLPTKIYRALIDENTEMRKGPK
ncbi:MAG TPA: hypothetical protein VKZ50_21000 [bacterium]|nr:hypothetical protein [bacterium]